MRHEYPSDSFPLGTRWPRGPKHLNLELSQYFDPPEQKKGVEKQVQYHQSVGHKYPDRPSLPRNRQNFHPPEARVIRKYNQAANNEEDGEEEHDGADERCKGSRDARVVEISSHEEDKGNGDAGHLGNANEELAVVVVGVVVGVQSNQGHQKAHDMVDSQKPYGNRIEVVAKLSGEKKARFWKVGQRKLRNRTS